MVAQRALHESLDRYHLTCVRSPEQGINHGHVLQGLLRRVAVGRAVPDCVGERGQFALHVGQAMCLDGAGFTLAPDLDLA